MTNNADAVETAPIVQAKLNLRVAIKPSTNAAVQAKSWKKNPNSYTKVRAGRPRQKWCA